MGSAIIFRRTYESSLPVGERGGWAKKKLCYGTTQRRILQRNSIQLSEPGVST